MIYFRTMSNLPIDARAILEYLNELGYRNISAEQLKEFMKGMQSQSELTTKNCNATNNNNKKKTAATTNPQSQTKQYQQEKGKELPDNKSLPARDLRSTIPTALRPRVIKSKRPLVNFKFYLDIRDQNLTRRIEEQIKILGATQDFFLNPYVTHFITDKAVLLSKTITGDPQNKTSNNNQSGYNYDNNNDRKSCLETSKLCKVSTINNTKSKNGTITKTVQTRTDAILSRARQGQTTIGVNKLVTANNTIPITTATDKFTLSQQKDQELASPSYVLWQTEYALKFFKKVQHELRVFLHPNIQQTKNNNSDSTKAISSVGRSGEAIPLKGSYIKIEAIKRNCRPYYQIFRNPSEWPKIELECEEGAFSFLPKKTNRKTTTNSVFLQTSSIAMTRKSRSSQRGAPLPAVVQALRKASNATNLASTPRAKAGNSSCRQAKESSEKQCGVCEICKIEYDTLTIHLKSKAHEYFAKNPHNFIALDTLIQSSADVNKFLNENDDIENDQRVEEQTREEQENINVKIIEREESEKMEVDEEVTANVASPLEDPLFLADRPSPLLREKSKRSTKGKHSSEKFQFTHAVTTTNKLNSAKTPPKKQMSLELENTSQTNFDTTTICKMQKITNSKGNLSSHIRTLIPPSSIYKVVGTSEVETTPIRGQGNKATGMDSPSIIVKFKKVRQTELLRLNGEAEKFMFSNQRQKQRRASSDLPTDMDRPSISSEQQLIRNNTQLSSSSLDSSCYILDDYVNNVSNGRKINVSEVSDKRRTNKTMQQSFQNAPIQPDKRQLKNKSVGRKRLNNNNNSLNELSPPSAAAAIVAATAKIQLPAATRKSSRMATAIVTAATTSSRLLRAAADAVKKSSNTTHMSMKKSKLATAVDLTSSKKSTRLASNTEITVTPTVTSIKLENTQEEKSDEQIAVTGGRIRQCRLAATAAVVKMEDRMGDSESECNITTDNDDVEEEDKSSNDSKNAKNFNKSSRKVKIKNNGKKTREKLIDEDFKCKLNKKNWCIDNRNSKSKINLNVKYKRGRQHKRKTFKFKKLCESEQNRLQINQIEKKLNRPMSLLQKRSKNITQMYDYKKSEKLQQLNYSFERLPTTDLWYRVFNRQDACEERFFEYYGTRNYRKLPYELGPIPFYHAGLSKNKCQICNCLTTTKSSPKTLGTVASDNVSNQNDKVSHGKVDKQQDNEKEVKIDNVTLAVKAVKSTMPEKLTEKSTYTHKHKKMHLLQRYRQEQEALHQEEFKNRSFKIEDATNSTCIENDSWSNATPNLSKENSPERLCDNNEQQKRARSISALSTTSSCASSHATTDTTLTATTTTKKVYRNKHLQKVSVLNFELPPRKSPREHASTLAFVSEIIKQRQESKPNSDADEACTTSSTPISTINTPIINEEPKSLPLPLPPPSPLVSTTLETNDKDETFSLGRNKHLDIATPTEEMCFATEISENVKRIRRGRNKYDHSPPYVASTKPRRLGVSKYAKVAAFNPQQQQPKRRYTYKKVITATREKSHLHSKDIDNLCLSSNKNNKNDINLPGIRKIGQKKGVLDFEVDSVALQTLDTALLYSDVRHLENQIDNFLETSGKDMDADIKDLFHLNNINLREEGVIENKNNNIEDNREANCISLTNTDYFSSDFNLCDLFNFTKSTIVTDGSVNVASGKSNNLSLYNAVALNTYFRKRKYIKSNRTGWPKLQKKKYAMRHQTIKDKHNCSKSESKTSNNEKVDTEHSVMTPPNSEYDETLTNVELIERVTEDDSKNVQHNDEVVKDVRLYHSDHIAIEEENDNILDLNVVKTEDDNDEEEGDYEGSAEEADDEDEFHDAELEDDTADFPDSQKNELNKIEQEDFLKTEHNEIKQEHLLGDGNQRVDKNEIIAYDEANYARNGGCEKKRKCARFKSRLGKALAHCFSSTAITKTAQNMEADDTQEDIISLVANTSTPSSHMLRGLRRAPQLNSSLLSCNSPSEKAGDNSDIFTVSSDGLDTDLDLSNPPVQSRILEKESLQHRSFNKKTKTKINTYNPINKYNISTKFVPNQAINSCAAEAVTAATKTLAIAQFLKKEVRVTCRRIRAPFRRFRYRR